MVRATTLAYYRDCEASNVRHGFGQFLPRDVPFGLLNWPGDADGSWNCFGLAASIPGEY
jgi:hypothetical protein